MKTGFGYLLAACVAMTALSAISAASVGEMESWQNEEGKRLAVHSRKLKDLTMVTDVGHRRRLEQTVAGGPSANAIPCDCCGGGSQHLTKVARAECNVCLEVICVPVAND